MPKLSMLRKEESPEEIVLTKGELREWAKKTIVAFFSDKQFQSGGKIPECLMLTKENLETVVNVNFEFGFKYAYHFLFPKLKVEKDQIYKKNTYDLPIPFHVRYAILLLKDMRKKGIPKLFHPGLILLYFKLCKGCEFSLPENQIRCRL